MLCHRALLRDGDYVGEVFEQCKLARDIATLHEVVEAVPDGHRKILTSRNSALYQATAAVSGMACSSPLTAMASANTRPTYVAGRVTPNTHAAVAGTSRRCASSRTVCRTEPPPRMRGIDQLRWCSSQ